MQNNIEERKHFNSLDDLMAYMAVKEAAQAEPVKQEAEPVNQPVNVTDFLAIMQQHWERELGNVTNPRLVETWKQIAETFLNQIDGKNANKWKVLSPACGTGKTESSIVFSAMLGKLEGWDHPGVLMVTRLIEDCERIADRINHYARKYAGREDWNGKPYAVPYHTRQQDYRDEEITLADLKHSPVVVMTHRAYEIAMDQLGAEGGDVRATWQHLYEWNSDRRKLVIIDESLDIVEHRHITIDRLEQTLTAIPRHLRLKHPEPIKAIQGMIRFLEFMERHENLHKNAIMVRDAEGIELEPNYPEFTGLIDDLREVRFDYQIGIDNPQENARLKKRCLEGLKAVDMITRLWGFYKKEGLKHSLNSARLIVPPDLDGAPVVLDATASTNIVYDLHDDSERIDPPKGSRSYKNLTIHVSRGHRVGKNYMIDKAKTACPDLINNLNETIPSAKRKVLVVCHKQVEPVLSKFDTHCDLSTGHWGGIDGSNQWKDCDTVVIFGLNYMPSYWSPNTFFAMQTPPEALSNWFKDDGDRRFKQYGDIRKELEHSKHLTEIIQAILRIRARKVSDTQGNCPKCEAYLLLPEDELGDYIVNGLKTAMPGVVIRDWKYRKLQKKAKASKHGEALAAFIRNMTAPACVSMTRVMRDLGMSKRTLMRLTATLQDPQSELSLVLLEAGVSYSVQRQGKTQAAYFVKDA